jgi:hypothetical protein
MKLILLIAILFIIRLRTIIINIKYFNLIIAY